MGFQPNRHTRYLGVIVRDRHVLLIKQRLHGTGHSFWFFPGGGMEPGETEEKCVQREMKEETNLDVKVVGLLLDEPATGIYQRVRTYLCEPVGGEASPGYDPEYGPAEQGVLEVRWFDLRTEADWEPAAANDPITYRYLQLIRAKLGHSG